MHFEFGDAFNAVRARQVDVNQCHVRFLAGQISQWKYN